jgi:hypothetical protein
MVNLLVVGDPVAGRGEDGFSSRAPTNETRSDSKGVVQSFARGAVILSGLVAQLPARQTASEKSREGIDKPRSWCYA